MRIRGFTMIAGAGVAAFTCLGAQAQSTASAPSVGMELEEIVVTARRRDESLQDVPQVVNAVTSDTIERLNLLNFADVQSVVPGLNLAGTNTGYSTTASIRGASYNQETGASGTVVFYLNDTAVDGNFIFQSMYDVGQIEVLRGPQGTLRGSPSPSGSITLTTRKPDLSEFGGYVSASGTNQNGTNVQGALNVPVISDKLAVRLAAVFDENELDGVHSVNSRIDPNQETKSGRVSVRFEPTDALSANVMYQHLAKDVKAFDQVYGTGHTSGNIANSTRSVSVPLPATIPTPASGYNGPSIDVDSRLAITDAARDVDQETDVVTGQLDWRVGGQMLSYAGSYLKLQIHALAPRDTANLIPGYDFFQDLTTISKGQTHELRLSSEERLAGIFDYTVGVHYQDQDARTLGLQVASFLQGAFGNPAATPVVGPPNSRYLLPLTIDIPSLRQQETSGFASLTWHITEQTELTGGARYIVQTLKGPNRLQLGSGFIGLPWGLPGAFCTGAGGQFGATYPGVCDMPVAASTLQDIYVDVEDKPTIYNVAVSHHFSDSLLAYANTGTSFRQGPVAVGITSQNVTTDPVLRSLVFHDSEKAVAYEVGFKSTFLDNRARVNLALYQQKFDGYLFYTPQAINYLQVTPTGTTRSSANFTANADAEIKGVDLDAAYQITSRWNASLAASYVDAKLDDARVPCNDSNLDGVPDNNAQSDAQLIATLQGAGQSVAVCQSNASINRFPKWNTSLESEYAFPVAQNTDAYIRGLWTYYPKNDQTESGGIVAASYNLLNLYLGIRDPGGAWDVSLFGRNVTNTSKILTGGGDQVSSSGGIGAFFGNSGYNVATTTPQREFGVRVRYAFGSR